MKSEAPEIGVAVEIFRQVLGSAAAPWFAPYSPLVQEVCATPSRLVAALNTARTDRSLQGIRFVEQSALVAGEPYESFIARTRVFRLGRMFMTSSTESCG